MSSSQTAARYVARKVGSSYEVVRTDAMPTRISSSLYVAGGTILAWKGIRSLGTGGLLLAGVGACMLYRGATGTSLLERLTTDCGKRKGHGPSYQNEGGSRSGQKPTDDVEEASMESFPASDPPAHSRPA